MPRRSLVLLCLVWCVLGANPTQAQFLSLAEAAPDQAVTLRDRMPDLRTEAAPIVGRRVEPSSRQAGDKVPVIIQYDDGELDNGYGANETADSVEVGMLFELPGFPATVEQISICFARLGTQDALDFTFRFYDNDGTGGAPGTLLGAFTGMLEDMPPSSFYTFDFSSLNFVLNDDDFIVVAEWDPGQFQDFFFCADFDRSRVQPGFIRTNGDNTWTSLVDFDDEYTALLLRGIFDLESEAPRPCVDDDTTLCLLGERFEVRAEWRRANGQTGVGQAVKLTPDTGYFWFFNDQNVEMVLKVLEACESFNRFWVFAGGLTNVEVEIFVTDTETGESRTYRNPINTPFQPIQDTQAFSTCP